MGIEAIDGGYIKLFCDEVGCNKELDFYKDFFVVKDGKIFCEKCFLNEIGAKRRKE